MTYVKGFSNFCPGKVEGGWKVKLVKNSFRFQVGDVEYGAFFFAKLPLGRGDLYFNHYNRWMSVIDLVLSQQNPKLLQIFTYSLKTKQIIFHRGKFVCRVWRVIIDNIIQINYRCLRETSWIKYFTLYSSLLKLTNSSKSVP